MSVETYEYLKESIEEEIQLAPEIMEQVKDFVESVYVDENDYLDYFIYKSGHVELDWGEFDNHALILFTKEGIEFQLSKTVNSYGEAKSVDELRSEFHDFYKERM